MDTLVETDCRVAMYSIAGWFGGWLIGIGWLGGWLAVKLTGSFDVCKCLEQRWLQILSGAMVEMGAYGVIELLASFIGDDHRWKHAL